MSFAGVAKAGAAFAKSLFRASSKSATKAAAQNVTKSTTQAVATAAKRTALTTTEKAVISDIKSAEKAIFKSAKKTTAPTTGYKNEFVESWSGKTKAIKTYEHGDLTDIANFDKNGKVTSVQSVFYNNKNQPACLLTVPANPNDLNMYYRLYNYAPNGTLQSIGSTTQISDRSELLLEFWKLNHSSCRAADITLGNALESAKKALQ